MSKTVFKLYELTRGDKFTIVNHRDTTVYTFHKVDGMYSYITDKTGAINHFICTLEVNKVNE